MDAHTLETTHCGQFQSKKFILCAGGHARRLPFPGAEYALTHSDVWSLKTLQKSIAIIGAAATGCQLASIFRDFGSEVWLLELASRIVPGEDVHVSQAMEAAFKRKGINVLTGFAGVERIEKGADGLQVMTPNGTGDRVPPVDAVIMANGWRGMSKG